MENRALDGEARLKDQGYPGGDVSFVTDGTRNSPSREGPSRRAFATARWSNRGAAATRVRNAHAAFKSGSTKKASDYSDYVGGRCGLAAAFTSTTPMEPSSRASGAAIKG